MDKLYGVKSNWEFVIWYLISAIISPTKDHRFSRQKLLRKNYDDVYDILILQGHKKRPQHTEETIQKTLQNMRDKNWIIFLGSGEYKLTSEGVNEFLKHKENIEKVQSLDPAQRQLLRKLARE
ncbi:MAG: hypothetical protein FD159_2703 [Syntrophaceae bacterium]|nr:MAG: hypothetical protein FD159_2703 [Syntrophaceae bacterium]